jgi:hypothetical protein
MKLKDLMNKKNIMEITIEEFLDFSIALVLSSLAFILFILGLAGFIAILIYIFTG